jgi:tetratricopeptide (TPR) repeat protein
MITLSEIAKTPTLLASKLRRLEMQGRFNAALQGCLEVADGKAYIPALEGTSPRERAELLLRYGALIGFFGHNSQVVNSQEQSKDLLTKALAEYIDLGDEQKIAECENYIALAYWRLGELNEATVWLESSTARVSPKRSYARLHRYIVASLVNIDRKHFQENIELLIGLEDDFLLSGNDLLSGMYFSNLGVSLKDLGQREQALTCFERALRFFELSKHRIYTGTVENNIALLYSDMGLYEKAHYSIDNATKIFLSAKDKTRAGYSLDTKSNIFLSEGEFHRALETIDRSIDILKRGENAGYCVESMLTRSRVLLHLDRFADAVLTLMSAVETQRIKIGEEASRELIENFEAELSRVYSERVTARSLGSTDPSGVHLILPRSLGSYSSYSAIRINNTFLERYGLKKGTLAVIVDETVVRGDLAAIEEIRDGSVRCGIYDSDFGLVCLDRGDQEPELFDASEVRVLGKIIGVGENVDTLPGQVVVQPISV